MEFDQYYVVHLRKGPTWAPDSSPELEILQERHLAHLAHMAQTGRLLVAGPVQVHEPSDLRGITILPVAAFGSVAEARALVEQDPAVQAGRLVADLLTWFVPKGSQLRSDWATSDGA